MHMNILLVVIVLQFIFMVYSDFQNRKERELLQLKLMSKDIDDYKSALEDTPEDSKKEENPYLDMDEVGIEQLLKTKEKR
jgi:hypothetical protein